ncbi:hypothetical protein ACWDAZ_29740, partial [Streptomyces sp. NPDC001215]
MIYAEASMDALRQAGDELADATVAALFERGEVGKFNTLMRYVSTAGAPLPDGLPDVAREYHRHGVVDMDAPRRERRVGGGARGQGQGEGAC